MNNVVPHVTGSTMDMKATSQAGGVRGGQGVCLTATICAPGMFRGLRDQPHACNKAKGMRRSPITARAGGGFGGMGQ